MINYDNKVGAHYDRVAGEHGLSADSTMTDRIIRQKETEAILSIISAFVLKQKTNHSRDGGYAAGPKNLDIMDVGCGNGYTLSKLGESFPEAGLFGVEKNDNLRLLAQEAAPKASIIPGDIREPLITRTSVVVCQRVIINLLDRDHQKTALQNIMNSLVPGGLVIFIEAFESGLANLNQARAEFGLPPISPANHNLYLEDDFFDGLNPYIEENPLSTHYYVSRVLHDLALNGRPFTKNSHFVSLLSQSLPNVGDYAPLRIKSFLNED